MSPCGTMCHWRSLSKKMAEKYWLMFTPVNFFKHDLDSLKLSEEMEGLGLWWSTSSKAWYYPDLYVETPCADPRTELDNLAAEIFAEIKEE